MTRGWKAIRMPMSEFHALTDAILVSSAPGIFGQHFPPGPALAGR